MPDTELAPRRDFAASDALRQEREHEWLIEAFGMTPEPEVSAHEERLRTEVAELRSRNSE